LRCHHDKKADEKEADEERPLPARIRHLDPQPHRLITRADLNCATERQISISSAFTSGIDLRGSLCETAMSP
jgi:hypothetical protein